MAQNNDQIDNIILTNSQQRALNMIMDFVNGSKDRVFILKGYAGTGKTTLVKAIIKKLTEKERGFHLLASTGKAAKVLSNATGVPVKTIHSEIYKYCDINEDIDLFKKEISTSQQYPDKSIYLKFALKTIDIDDKNPYDIYIIDEASMISDTKQTDSHTQAQFGAEGRLLNDMLTYAPLNKFIFIGDDCQLPPVRQVFSPALNAAYFKSAFGINAQEYSLTEIMRQSKNNDIAIAANSVRTLSQNQLRCGNYAMLPLRGFHNIHLISNETVMLNMYYDCIKDKEYSNATLITLSNKSACDIAQSIRPRLGFRGGEDN